MAEIWGKEVISQVKNQIFNQAVKNYQDLKRFFWQPTNALTLYTH